MQNTITPSETNDVGQEHLNANKFNKREVYFYNMINKFYRNCQINDINMIISIVNGESQISRRILDWFVTRYSNKKKVLINTNDGLIDVHISYKAQLKSYKKKYFDPFGRRGKFDYRFEIVENTINTNIGQLNFFRWAIENEIIKYINTNFEMISKEMSISNKNDKKRKTEKISDASGASKVSAIVCQQKIDSENANIGINVSKEIKKDQVKIILTFD